MPLSASDKGRAGIYQFANLTNGKIYVGQSVDLYKRYYQHAELKTQTLFGRALRKYGLGGFEFSVLEYVSDLAQLNEREQYWIDRLMACDRTRGYNTCTQAGSSRGTTHTPKTKALLAELRRGSSATPETRAKVAASSKERYPNGPMFGRKHTAETLEKMTRSRTGKTLSAKHRANIGNSQKTKKPVAQVDLLTGNVIQIWGCINDAAKHTGADRASVSCIVNGGKKKSSGGFGWRYPTEADLNK